MRVRKKYNKYPFIILAVIHLIMLIYTLYKIKDRKRLVILLFSNIGFAYLFEYLVVPLLNGYKYKPGIMKTNFLDNILGSVLSQAVYVPITALFISGFQLGWKVKLFFIMYFGAIERIFIKWDIYKNHWWKTIYTIITIAIYFGLSDAWYKQLKDRKPIILFISLFNMIQVTWMNIIFVLAILCKLCYGKNLFILREHFKLAPLVGIFVSFCITFLVRGGRWLNIVVALSTMSLTDAILIKKKLLKVRAYFVLPLVYVLVISFSIFYSRMIYGENNS